MAPPAPANAVELREALRLRQERWFSERAAERERATATAELMSERPSHDDADLVAEASTSANPGPEAILDRITERLASRLRTELRTEVEAAAAAGQEHAKANSASMEAFLASEIESHTCPICYELMLAPERPPILLFPCGHSFCGSCLQQHIDVHGKGRCPVCRKSIASRAVNVPLQQLIQSYQSEKNRVQVQPSAPPQSQSARNTPRDPGGGARMDGDDGGDVAEYVRQHRTLSVRRRILTNEHTDTVALATDLRRRLEASELVSAHLAEEEAAALERVRHAEEELALVRSHLARQAETQQSVLSELEDAEARAALLQRTLDPLEAELAKTRCLVAALDPGRVAELGEESVESDG